MDFTARSKRSAVSWPDHSGGVKRPEGRACILDQLRKRGTRLLSGREIRAGIIGLLADGIRDRLWDPADSEGESVAADRGYSQLRAAVRKNRVFTQSK